MTIQFRLLHPQMTLAHLGMLPFFFSEKNEKSAAQQIAENYIGGWSPMPAWRHTGNYMIKYPGDPAMQPLAIAKLRQEIICFYEHEFVGIFQPDGTFEVSRVD